jgi:hypothetical protein
MIAFGGFLWITSHVLRDTPRAQSKTPVITSSHASNPSTGKRSLLVEGSRTCGLTADPSGDVWVANCYPTAGSHDNVVRIDAGTCSGVSPERACDPQLRQDPDMRMAYPFEGGFRQWAS